MADKRIIELANEKLVLADGDMTIVDSESGTYKYDLNRLAKKTITDTTLSIEGKPADAKAVGDALASVDVDTVDNARQLLSESYVLDEEPYLFRASGGDGADRVEECIVGGSVGWNQLCNAASVTVTNGHKYISKVVNTWTVGASTGSAITGLTSGTDMVIDLTTLFGPTIADYIFSLEQATAGAGVAWFKKYFPEDYYPYSAPTLKHVEGVSAKEVVGFNQWDEEWEVGAWSTSTGQKYNDSFRIRCKNYIRVIPNSTYYINAPYAGSSCYDADKNFISSTPYSAVSGNSNAYYLLIPNNAHYITFYMGATYGTEYKNDICISLSDPKNGQYEPYHKNIYPLDSTLTLRGIPKLTDGKMWFDGDKYNADGTVERRYGIVDLGTLSWELHGSFANTFYTNNFGTIARGADIICSKYPSGVPYNNYQNMSDKTVYSSVSTNRIAVKDTAYSTAAAFKTAMSGVYLVYETETPTTETATPYTSIQTLDPHGTEEFVSTGIVPIGHYSKYLENLRSKIEGLPRDFSTLIAPTEETYKATQNYTVGKLLIVNNILYKVTANIANGANIVPNTNVTAKPLSEIIAELA